jgi:hypothetical protein
MNLSDRKLEAILLYLEDVLARNSCIFFLILCHENKNRICFKKTGFCWCGYANVEYLMDKNVSLTCDHYLSNKKGIITNHTGVCFLCTL